MSLIFACILLFRLHSLEVPVIELLSTADCTELLYRVVGQPQRIPNCTVQLLLRVFVNVRYMVCSTKRPCCCRQVISSPFWTSAQSYHAIGGARQCCCQPLCTPIWASWLHSVSQTPSQWVSGTIICFLTCSGYRALICSACTPGFYPCLLAERAKGSFRAAVSNS